MAGLARLIRIVVAAGVLTGALGVASAAPPGTRGAPAAAPQSPLATATQLVSAGKYTQALATIDTGLAQRPADLPLLQLKGEVMIELRDVDGAIAAFQAYIAAGARGTNKREAEKIIQNLSAAPLVDITLSSGSAEIYLDSKLLGVLCTAAPTCSKKIMPGVHKILVEQQGFQPVAQRITLEGGKPAQVAVTMVELPSQLAQADPKATIDDAAVSNPHAPIRSDPATPNKTDEKAGANESLEKTSTNPWVAGVTPADQRAALVLFREGNNQPNDGLFVNAVNKYREALKHWNHPAIHYNLSLALLNLDQPIEVYDELNNALQYGAAPLEKDKYDHAKEYLLLVEKQLADVEVSCDKIGAKVSVDGKEVFVAPGKYSQKVRVGKHTFYADKQGYNARITAPYIGPAEKFRIELKLYTAEELTRYRRKWDNTWFPYVIVGAGLVVGGVGGLLEHEAQNDYNKYNAAVGACNTPAAGCSTKTPGIMDLHHSGDTKRTLGLVGYGVASATIASGAVLLYVNRREAYQISAEELNATPGGVAFAPLVTLDTVGASVFGHF